MNDYKTILKEGEGYKIIPGFVPSKLINDFKKRLTELYPVRASSSKKVYAEREDIKSLEDISVWWSQGVNDWEELKAIRRLLDPVIYSDFSNLEFYFSDVVTISKGSTWVSPHVDTPHRFAKWNFDKRLLGIQCIISLDDINKNSASTGLVPYSQKRDFEINKCYTGSFDRWFMENVKQHDMPRGSLLMYNCRVLHSSMPNLTDKDRPALLLNYLDKTVVKDVSEVDNIWTSNGKRP